MSSHSQRQAANETSHEAAHPVSFLNNRRVSKVLATSAAAGMICTDQRTLCGQGTGTLSSLTRRTTLATLVAASFVLFLVDVPVVGAQQPATWAKQHLPELVELYRHFHTHPELSFKEEKTAARLADELKKVGAEVTDGVGGHGVVALLKNGKGPTVMLRTDLDGLPVTEQTELVYASQVRVPNEEGVEVGVMHACGHDIHITNLIGTARYMAAHKNQWSGTLMLIGQPAEERGAGAAAMLKDGLFTRFPKPDYAVALHVDAAMEAGKIGCRQGFSLANVDSVDIEIKGRGGHGAYPHATVDPVVQAAEFVMSLQTIVSREIEPVQPAVITVGSIHGGTKHNVIGNTCRLQLTVRSYSDRVRQHLLDGIRRKAEAVATGARAPMPNIKVTEGTPALFNDLDLSNRLAEAFQAAVGGDAIEQAEQSMGGEDFSRYGKAGVPIVMYRLGTIESKRLQRYKQLGQTPPSLHSPLFYPDAEPTLETGVTTMASAAMLLLQKR